MRRAAIFPALIAAILVAGSVPAEDAPVRLALANDGTAAMRCLILFGHWVTIDLGSLQPGETRQVEMRRGTPQGALYMPRFDGRQMMIENIMCGTETAWADSLDQVPLMPIRETAGARYAVACNAGQRVSCAVPRPVE